MTHVSDFGVGALSRLRWWAELPVNTRACGCAPNTLIGGVSVFTQTAVFSSHWAVIQHDCWRGKGEEEEEEKGEEEGDGGGEAEEEGGRGGEGKEEEDKKNETREEKKNETEKKKKKNKVVEEKKKKKKKKKKGQT